MTENKFIKVFARRKESLVTSDSYETLINMNHIASIDLILSRVNMCNGSAYYLDEKNIKRLIDALEIEKRV